MWPKKEVSKSEWSSSGDSLINRTISEVKGLNPEDVRRAASELSSQVRDTTLDLYDSAVGYVRKNPIKSAIGLGAVGFAAGLLAGLVRKSSK